MTAQRRPSLTDVPGITLGHAHDLRSATGLTAILCPDGAVGGMALTGGSTSTRQTGGLTPGHVVSQVHGVLFSGGSAFGLDSAAGVMAHLEEMGVGFDVGVAKVPIVPTAAIFDLRLGDPQARPGPEMAREACRAATDEPVLQGSVGVGCGATVGKLFGIEQATKGGLGSWSIPGSDGLVVGGLVALNAFGDIHTEDGSRIIAGARKSPESKEFADAERTIREDGREVPHAFRNTTLALVATNAGLNRGGCIRVAKVAAQHLARVIRPYGTMFDGDLVICLSIGEIKADPLTIGLMAGQTLIRSTHNAVLAADGLGYIVSAGECLED